MVQELTEYLKFGLSRPPSKVGLKVCPEERLAKRLDLSVRQVRKAMSQLESDGILIRQRGKGTFVRKVPEFQAKQFSDKKEEPVFPWEFPIENIFADRHGEIFSKSDLNNRFAVSDKCMSISMWMDVNRLSETWRLVLAGAINRADELGHRVSVHSTSNSWGQENSADVESLKSFVNEHRCDGYIVPTYFEPFLRKALENTSVPYVFYQLGMKVEQEPVVILGWEEAIERGMQKLVDYGWNKIASVWSGDISGMSSSAHIMDIPSRVLRENNLEDVRSSVISGGVGQVFGNVRKLLDQQDRPGAILVTDDYLLEGVYEAIKSKGLKLGKDIGLIAVSHKNGVKLPEDVKWSQMEFDTEAFGKSIFDKLLIRLENADADTSSQVHLAHWVPGQTCGI